MLIGGNVGREFGVKVAEVMMVLILLSMRLSKSPPCHELFPPTYPAEVQLLPHSYARPVEMDQKSALYVGCSWIEHKK